MSVNTFDESKVRRGQPDNAGKFASKMTSDPTDELKLIEDAFTDDERLVIGEGLTRISAADARRALPVGERVRTVYLDLSRKLPESVRTVKKQSAYEMVTSTDDGQDVHLGWARMTAERDSSGSVIISDEHGRPFVAFVPIDDGDDTSIGTSIAHPVAAEVHRSRMSDSVSELDEVARNTNADAVYQNVAMNPAASPATLDYVAARTGYESAQAELVSHANVTGMTLARLASSTHRDVRREVALHDGTPPTTVDRLARDEDDRVRDAVARSVNVSPEVLESLSHDPTARQSVASNPRTPADVLDRLAKSDGFTMAEVAKNPGTRTSTLRELAEDRSTGNQTRAMVAKNPSVPADLRSELVWDEDSWVRRHAASNSALSRDEQEILAGDFFTDVRQQVARNQSVAPDVLGMLATDEGIRVRNAVAMNPAAPVETLDALATDGDNRVLAGVAWNDSASRSTLEKLAARNDGVGYHAERALSDRNAG